MAKKKKKQVSQNSNYKLSDKNAVRKEREKSLRSAFNFYRHSSGVEKTKDPYAYDGYDMDETRVKRRSAAVLATLDAFKQYIGRFCPDRENVENFEEQWFDNNAMLTAAYDIEENYRHTSFAAAIWIMDQIREMGLMEKASPLLLRGLEQSPKANIPDVHDPSHSKDVLLSAATIIRNRNMDCVTAERKGKVDRSYVDRVFMDELTAKKLHKQDVHSRILFESLVELIPHNIQQRAIDRFHNALADWLKRLYTCINIYDEKMEAVYSEANTFFDEWKNASRLQIGPEGVPLPTISCGIGIHSDLGEKMITGIALQQSGTRKAIFEEIADQKAHMLETSRDIAVIRFDELERKCGREAVNIWSDFRIENPYELAFAFLKLLDDGSDLPWVYFPCVHFMSCVSDLLPWAADCYRGDLRGVWADMPDDGDILEMGYHKADIPKQVKMPEKEDWLAPKYIDRFEDDMEYSSRVSLAQIMYEATGCIMPRNIDRFDIAARIFAEKYGYNGKRKLSPLLYCATLLGETKNQSKITPLALELSSPAEYADSNTANEGDAGDSALQKIIDELKRENQMLRQNAYDLGRELREEKEKILEMEREEAQYRLELSDLRALIYNQQESTYDDNTPDESITFPYRTNKRIVVFGGHDSWAREIRPKLPDVRFIERHMAPNAELIRRADVVWIQTNSLCHAYFYKIIDEVRKYNIPVRYFSYASAVKCAEQLAKDLIP